MRTTIFITDNEFKIMRADLSSNKLKIERVIPMPIKSKIIEDGIIKNEKEFMKIIHGIKKTSPELFKNVTLVLDSRHTITKKIDIPRLNKKQIDSIVFNEMSDLSKSYGELVYDYSLFNQKKLLLCCAIPKNIVNDYEKIFLSQAIRFKKIDIGINSLIKLTQNIRNFKNKTFIINVIYSNNILSLLFENNKYVLSTRLKINEPKESDKYIDEIYNKLSTLIQFNKAQKSEYEINYAYYCALTDEQIKKLKEVNGYKNIFINDMKEIFHCELKYNPSDFILNTAGLYEMKNDINLLLPKKIKSDKAKLKFFSIYPVAAVLIVMILAMQYLVIYRDVQKIELQVNKFNLYVKDEANEKLYESAQKINTLLENSIKLNQNIKKFENDLSIIATLNSDKFNKIFSVCEENVSVSALSFTATTKLLMLDAHAVNASDITNFMMRLKNCDIFTSVEYQGYKMDSATQLYSFKATCYLKVGDKNE